MKSLLFGPDNWTPGDPASESGRVESDPLPERETKLPDAAAADPKTEAALGNRPKWPTPGPSSYAWLFRSFIAVNIMQYLLIFVAVPFSEVDNRPAGFVLSCLLGSLSFVLSALLLPAGLVHTPTRLSLTCSAATLGLKTIDVASNVFSVVVCLNAEVPMLEHHLERHTHVFVPSDITAYIQVVSILMLAAASVSMAMALLMYVYHCVHVRPESEKGGWDKRG